MKKNILKKTLSTIIIVLGLFAALYLALNKTGFWGRAFGTPANLVVDAGSSFSVAENTNWANFLPARSVALHRRSTGRLHEEAWLDE